VGAQGAMTVSASSIVYARYLRLGAIVFFTASFTATFGGTAGPAAFINAPVPYVGGDALAFTPAILVGGAIVQAAGQLTATSNLQVNLATNYTLGSSYTFRISGVYPST